MFKIGGVEKLEFRELRLQKSKNVLFYSILPVKILYKAKASTFEIQ